jgi:hypothetical protein
MPHKSLVERVKIVRPRREREAAQSADAASRINLEAPSAGAHIWSQGGAP